MDDSVTITVSNEAISTNSLPVEISGRPNIIFPFHVAIHAGLKIEDSCGMSPGKFSSRQN